MAFLYIAIKIHEPEAMDSQTILFLSQGSYTKEHVEAMERSILEALQWQINPPTAMAYIQEIISFLSNHVILDKTCQNRILELSKTQIKFAVLEFRFVPCGGIFDKCCATWFDQTCGKSRSKADCINCRLAQTWFKYQIVAFQDSCCLE